MKQKHSSTLSLTLVLDRGGWSMSRPGCFTLGEENRYPSYRNLGVPWGQPGWVWKVLPPPGFNPWTMQTIASHYSDCTILALKLIMSLSSSVTSQTLIDLFWPHLIVSRSSKPCAPILSIFHYYFCHPVVQITWTAAHYSYDNRNIHTLWILSTYLVSKKL